MRTSQKSNRNRGKGNRNKSMGNVTNRVFESNGPEGKVRGTPQQIIDKYEQLARDSQTSGDRVTSENFLQHAEHYARLLSAAQAEMQARQGGDQPDGSFGGNRSQERDQSQGGPQHQQQRRDPAEQPQPDAPMGGYNGRGEPSAPLTAIDPAEQDQPELVLTPEGGENRGPRRRRAPRRDNVRPQRNGGDGGGEPSGEKAASEGESGPGRSAGQAEGESESKPRRRSGRSSKSDDAAPASTEGEPAS